MAVTSPSTAVVEFNAVELHLPVRQKSKGTGTPSVQKAAIGGGIVRSRHGRYVAALNKVSFSIEPGERIALLGHNGAGKTSLLRMLCGIYQPTHGQCQIRGRVSALLTSTIGLDLLATGEENIRFASTLYGIPSHRHDEIVANVREFSELGDFLDLPVTTYSAGMRTRLGFSVVTAMDPDVLIIDEVLSTGDMAFARKAQERVLEFIGRARVLIVASHSADLMRMFCTRAFWMEHGELVQDGEFEDVWNAYYKSRSVEAGG